MTLDFVPTDDLLNELLKRYDHAVFCGTMDRPTPELPTQQYRTLRYVGDRIKCVGLATGMGIRIQQRYNELEETIDPTDL